MNLTVDMIGLSYTELMLIRNSDLNGAEICVRLRISCATRGLSQGGKSVEGSPLAMGRGH